MDKREAIDKVKENRLLHKKYFPPEKVYLLGSYAKETNCADSDIFVAIVVNHI